METRENRGRKRSCIESAYDIKDDAVRLLSPLRPLYFKEPVGLLFPAIMENGSLKLIKVPVVNNWTAVSFVRRYEQSPEFRAWAVHPFTGEPNATVKLPTMNE